MAKKVQNNEAINEQSFQNARSYVNFFNKCQKTGTLALPIFGLARNQNFSIVGQFISQGMAQAMSEVLRSVLRSKGGTPMGHASNTAHLSQKPVDMERVPYFPVEEINLDDNGLKDQAFSMILSALATQPCLKRISYVNNEIGVKSIEELEKMLSPDSPN